MRRFAAVLPPYAWLALFFLVPFLIVLKISLADQALGIPPYTPLLANGQLQASGANYQFLLSDSLYARAYLNAIWFAGWSTLGCLFIGYPLAYAIVRAPLRSSSGRRAAAGGAAAAGAGAPGMSAASPRPSALRLATLMPPRPPPPAAGASPAARGTRAPDRGSSWPPSRRRRKE